MVVCGCEGESTLVSSSGCVRVRVRVRVRVGRVSVGGVSHHAKLSNPRVGAVRGLLKRTCWARAPMCTCVRATGEGEGH